MSMTISQRKFWWCSQARPTFWFGQTKDIQHGRGDIAEGSLLLLAVLLVYRKLELLRVARHDEWHGICRVRGVRRTRLRVDHLLRVTVVGRNKQYVACLLASLVHGADSRIGMCDSFHSCLVYTSVPDLK